MNKIGNILKQGDYRPRGPAAKYDNYALTELGKEKAEEYGGNGPEFDVLNDLNDNGPSTLHEIAKRLTAEEKIIKAALERLIAKQRVTRVARSQ